MLPGPALILIFLASCSPAALGRIFPAENTGQSYFVSFSAPEKTPVDVVAGVEVILSDAVGRLGFVYTDYEEVTIVPEDAAADVVRLPMPSFSEPSFFLAPHPLPGYISIVPPLSADTFGRCEYLSALSQMVPIEFPDRIGMAAAAGPVYILCNRTRVYRAEPDPAHPPRPPVFRVAPIFMRLSDPAPVAIISFPDISPDPREPAVFRMSISVADGPVVDDKVTLRRGGLYTISPAPLDYTVRYSVLLEKDATTLASGEFVIRSADPLMTAPADTQGSVMAKDAPRPVLHTRLAVEPGQTLPRFPDSPGAFVAATIAGSKDESGAGPWVVVVNGRAFEPNGGPAKHVFVAEFGVDYVVGFVSQTAQTVPAALNAPPRGIIRQLRPAEVGCDGITLHYPVWTNINYTRPRPDIIVAEDGHVEKLDTTGPTVSACGAFEEPLSAETEEAPAAFEASISIAADWKKGLSEQDICDQKAVISVQVTSLSSSRLLYYVQWTGSSGEKLFQLDREGRFEVVETLPLAIDAASLDIFTDGGMRYLGKAPVVHNFVRYASSPIDYVHPQPLVLTPYRSPKSPGRLVVLANVTDHAGEPVDTNALSPGLYLSTAIHRFPEHGVTCVTRELVVIPLASSPYASIKAPLSSRTATCPVDIDAPTPFQIGVPPSPDLVLWNEETGAVRRLDTSDARVVTKTGVYQILDTKTGEYSSRIEFSPAPYTASGDFVFSLVPRKHKINVSDPLEPDHDLLFTYPRGLKTLSIWLADCRVFAFSEASAACPAERDMFLHLDPDGSLLLANLPYVSYIALELEIGGACRFRKSGHLLPPSDALPVEISRIECRTDCAGRITAVPFYIDPYSRAETPAPTLPGVAYESRLDGRLVSRIPLISNEPEPPAARDYTVEFVMVQGRRRVARSRVCRADPAPVFRPRVDLPVFCPDSADARAVLDGLNFEGRVSWARCDAPEQMKTVATSEAKSAGFAGLGAGLYCFNYTAVSRESGRVCTGEASAEVARKMYYHVNARATARPALDGAAEVEIRPGGEFDVLTADMLRTVESRVYVQDNDGAGATKVTGLPNGGRVEILIPYPETYSHITRDFCPEPLVLGVDRLVDMPGRGADDRSRKRGNWMVFEDYANDAKPITKGAQCKVEPAIQRVFVDDPSMVPWKTSLGWVEPDFRGIVQSVIANRTDYSVTVEYWHKKGCVFVVEWITIAKENIVNPRIKRRESVPDGEAEETPVKELRYQGTLSKIECAVTKRLSCPLCADAEVAMKTDALGPVFYTRSDADEVIDAPRIAGLSAGEYVISATERGGSFEYSPFCVAVVAFEGAAAQIVGAVQAPSTTVKGCAEDDRATFVVDIHTAPGPVPLYAMTDTLTGPPPSDCSDPRFVPSSRFELLVGRRYRAAICDGAEVRVYPADVRYDGVDRPGAPRVHIDANGALIVDEAVGDVRIERLEGDATGPRTLLVVDDRDCPTFVEVDAVSVYLPGPERAMAVTSFSVPQFDCIINSTQTVAEAVDEIVWCAGQEAQITGNAAPVIDVPVVLPARATLDMEFLQFSAGLTFGGETIAFLLDVDILAGAANVTAASVTFSYGDWGPTAALLIGDTAGVQQQQQQVNVQYAAVASRLDIRVVRGRKELVINLAYFDAPLVSVEANRTTVLQLLTANLGEVEVWLPEEPVGGRAMMLQLSTNGGSRIDVLTVFLPGGNVSGVNGTWTSSNATLRTACDYLLTYPNIVASARGGYGGPVFVDRETCIDFGGGDGVSFSQSQSRSPLYYEPVGFPKEIAFFFVGILIVVVIAGVVIAFAFLGF